MGQIRLHTENQLPRLSGSALKVPGGVGGEGGPTHYQAKLQLMLRLSWAVTIRKYWKEQLRTESEEESDEAHEAEPEEDVETKGQWITRKL